MKRLILFTLLAAVSSSLFGQPTFKADHYWLNSAIGNNTITGETMNLGFFTQLKQHVFGISFTVNNEELDNPFINKHPNLFNHDIAFLYGRRWSENFGYISVYTGASLVIGDDRGSLERTVDFFKNRTYEFYEKNSFVTAGLPVQAEIKLMPVPWMGVGITAIGNVNAAMPYAAVMFSASFGPLISQR